ncbi:sulfatase [uncultured Sphaerochaeta sp.]|uniref:sulfatase n=1 Tax=uncultured Sphaerochaeta sp. TaxID=886478 RepID=UPI002A0A82E0|nr:sulfatase [uncultured Sphaerochaeta sp.]
MKAIMVMFDSLRRDLLSVNGGPIYTPNFERLAASSVQFDSCYAGSLPCMPARRELHTGRYNFLHRSWGPLEPFDDSMPTILSENGIYTHLTTDHYHYVQDGGATYHGRYNSWVCNRGQESDQFVADLAPHTSLDAPNQLTPEAANERMRQARRVGGWQNLKNRNVIKREDEYPMAETFANGLDFLERNSMYDNWFLQIETFDPHEPFTSPDSFLEKFLDPDDFLSPDWPQYAQVQESKAAIEKMRAKYYALTSFCDTELGKVLDMMDKRNLWEDTMLIVNTDHGFLLSEHECWGKGTSPNYEELVHNPLFIYDPRSKCKGERRNSLVQTIDIAPTLLEFFGVARPKDMLGIPLGDTIQSNCTVHDYALFGYFGAPLGITDGRYVLFRNVKNPDIKVHEYTLFPTHMKSFFSLDELQNVVLSEPFAFTKGIKLMRMDAKVNPRFLHSVKDGDLLFDVVSDPRQQCPLVDKEITERLLEAAVMLFDENDAPVELYEYFGFPKYTL